MSMFNTSHKNKCFPPVPPNVSVFLWQSTQSVLPFSILSLNSGKWANGFMWSAFILTPLFLQMPQVQLSLLKTSLLQFLYSSEFLILALTLVLPSIQLFLFPIIETFLLMLIFFLVSSECFFPVIFDGFPIFAKLIFSLVSALFK